MSDPKPLLHAIGNAHIDPVWLWTWNEGLEAIRATFRSALDLLSEYPDFTFTSSSAAFYWMLEQVEPQMLDEIRLRVREGRWEIVGGWWVEPDVNIPCGEALVRQQLLGQKYFEQSLGVQAQIGYNPDTFGHCGSLPQILNGGGMRYYAFLRPGAHEKELPGEVFWWASDAGGRVLASRIHGAYTCWYDTTEGLEELVRANHAARPGYLTHHTLYFGVGNHGGGPTRRNIDLLIERKGREPEVRLSSLGSYFESVRDEVEGGAADAVPEVKGELQHHAPGCYSAHSEIKRENRRCEHALLTAEKLAVMARALVGRDYPREKLQEGWRLLLFNQFHDILAGTSVPKAYQDARDQLGRAASLASEVACFSLQSITAAVDTRGDGDALIVANPLPWPVRTPVEIEPAGWALADAEGRHQAFQQIQPEGSTGPARALLVADLPALGWKLYRQNIRQDAAAAEPGLRAGISSIENSMFRVEASESGGLLVFDRRSGEPLFAGDGVQAVVLDDPSDTWSHDVNGFRDEIGRFRDATVAVEEEGPVRACLRIESSWGDSLLTHRVYLYEDLDFIEIRTTVDWRQSYTMLKLAFPFSLEGAQAVYETPYGHETRAGSGGEEPGQQWVCLQSDSGGKTRGVALLNDGKYGFDVLGSELRVTAVRSPAYAHHQPTKLSPDRRYLHLDQGLQEIRFRVIPYEGSWQQARIPQRAAELNVPPLYVNEYEHPGKLPSEYSAAICDACGAMITAMKLAEDSDDVVVRVFEAGGLGSDGQVRVPLLNASWRVGLAAGEISTWRVAAGPGAGVVKTDMLEEQLNG